MPVGKSVVADVGVGPRPAAREVRPRREGPAGLAGQDDREAEGVHGGPVPPPTVVGQVVV